MDGIVVSMPNHRCLDLHRRRNTAECHQEIDLAAAHSKVLRHDNRTSFRQEASGQILSQPTHPFRVREQRVDTNAIHRTTMQDGCDGPRRAQRVVAGSSSSMFTSRNVLTWTRLTKRAGRCMSHTHASSRSSWK